MISFGPTKRSNIPMAPTPHQQVDNSPALGFGTAFARKVRRLCAAQQLQDISVRLGCQITPFTQAMAPGNRTRSMFPGDRPEILRRLPRGSRSVPAFACIPWRRWGGRARCQRRWTGPYRMEDGSRPGDSGGLASRNWPGKRDAAVVPRRSRVRGHDVHRPHAVGRQVSGVRPAERRRIGPEGRGRAATLGTTPSSRNAQYFCRARPESITEIKESRRLDLPTLSRLSAETG